MRHVIQIIYKLFSVYPLGKSNQNNKTQLYICGEDFQNTTGIQVII